MAKLTRPTHNKVFGSSALSAELTVFGGSTPSTNIDDILNSTEALRGWGTVGHNGFPPMEWFNALGYGLSYYAAYILQQGIAEWVSTQDYYINSRVIGSDGKEYKSLTGTSGTPNIGNDPVSDSVNWIDSFKAQIPTAINTSTAKTTPVDADQFGIVDSSASNVLKKITWANIKTALTALFAPIYSPAFTGTPTAPTAAVGTNTTQIATTAFVKAKSELDSMGVGQTWQDVTGSRALGTTYTNSTGKAIELAIYLRSSGTTTFTMSFNGATAVNVAYASGASNASISMVIPSGQTYNLTGASGIIDKWMELRQ